MELDKNVPQITIHQTSLSLPSEALVLDCLLNMGDRKYMQRKEEIMLKTSSGNGTLTHALTQPHNHVLWTCLFTVYYVGGQYSKEMYSNGKYIIEYFYQSSK